MYQSRVCYSVCVCVHSTRPGFKSIFHAAITSHAHVTKSTIVLKANILQFLCRYKALQESCLWVWATTQLFNTYTQCLSQPPARSFTQRHDDWKLKLIREPRHWHNDLSVWAPYNSIHVFIVSARTSKPLFKLRAARFLLNTNLFQSNSAECLNLEMIHINLSICTAPIGDNKLRRRR